MYNVITPSGVVLKGIETREGVVEEIKELVGVDIERVQPSDYSIVRDDGEVVGRIIMSNVEDFKINDMLKVMKEKTIALNVGLELTGMVNLDLAEEIDRIKAIVDSRDEGFEIGFAPIKNGNPVTVCESARDAWNAVKECRLYSGVAFVHNACGI